MTDLRRCSVDLVLAGRYRLKHLIARGGMAEVWRAEDDVLGRPIAVKVLLAHLAADESFMARFRREAIAAARLGHPSIVSTYDTGVEDGLAYIVMELVEGRTLRDALAEPGGIPPKRAVEVAAAVADALDYAHRHGVVHRDVKPANILLCGDGRVKVADFGIAKAAVSEDGFDQDLTQTGAILGTAKYLSPEQVEGRPADGRSDVYSLGVVLYEMLCGLPPFSADTDMALGAKHLSATPSQPRRHRPDLSEPLETLVLRALAKGPEQRFGSASELADALRAVESTRAPAAAVTTQARPIGLGGGLPTGLGPAADGGGAAPSPGAATDPTVAQPGRPHLRRQPKRQPKFGPVGIALGAVLMVILATIAVVRSGGDGDEKADARGGGTPPSQNAPTLTIVGANAFDPAPGDGDEHNEELANLTDGSVATTWRTQQYTNSRFGNLKPGVGLVIRLDEWRPVNRLSVVSPRRGWTAEVVAASVAATDRFGWGPAITRATATGATTVFELGGQRASVLLLWITDLGSGQNSTEIAEISAS